MTPGEKSGNLRKQRIPFALLFLWFIAVNGYFGAWVLRQPRSAALAWNAYELFNLLRFLPEIETGAVHANLHTFRLPLLGLAMLLPLLMTKFSLPESTQRWVRVSTIMVSGLLCMMTLPPYPEILSAWKTPGWRVAFWWAVIAGCAVLITALHPIKNPRLRGWSIIGVILLTGVPALITRQRLTPALVNLHQAPVQWGAGLWLWVVSTGLILVVQWGELFDQSESPWAMKKT